jgi:predicted TIM-barrel fold metal-dependent hydrolase
MHREHLVIDADSHKCENPAVFFDYVAPSYRDRLRFVRDRYGEQRFAILDRAPGSGELVERFFLQPEGYGKGTFRPYHEETTLGGLFNRVRIEHMDREGIDHQVIYGSIPLAFNSLHDVDLMIALCRAYNDYIHDDVAPYADRLHPVAFLPLADPDEALREMRRCVLELGMPAVCVPPNLPMPHPAAPDAFPEIRVPKQLSHPDFRELLKEAERLDVSVGIHGVPGAQYAGGTSDQLDNFTLVHVFANRSMQQMAMSSLMFDGVFDACPQLRVGFLEAGAGWLPDFVHSLHEHWEKRIVHFDPSIEPRIGQFLREFARERHLPASSGVLQKARQLLSCLTPGDREASAEELQAFRHEHPHIQNDPWTYVERGQVFVTVEPDDPAPTQLRAALGELGTRICGLAIDYGHWDATLADCVAQATNKPGMDAAFARRLVCDNALEFYGSRLQARINSPLAKSA